LAVTTGGEADGLLQVDARKAFWLARTALRLIGRGNRIEIEAGNWFSAGQALLVQRRMKGSLGHLNRALVLFRELGNPGKVGRAQVRRMHALTHLERYDEMRQAADEALEIFREADDVAGEGEVYFTLGATESRQERFRPALDYYARAREPLKKSAKSLTQLATLDGNVARCLESLYRFRAARRYFERARWILAEAGLRHYVAQLDYNRGYFAFMRGRYVEAISLFAAAEAVFREVGDRQNIGQVNLDRAEWACRPTPAPWPAAPWTTSRRAACRRSGRRRSSTSPSRSCWRRAWSRPRRRAARRARSSRRRARRRGWPSATCSWPAAPSSGATSRPRTSWSSGPTRRSTGWIAARARPGRPCCRRGCCSTTASPAWRSTR
jgi:tetratricopeptide (TPR) repeat protein